MKAPRPLTARQEATLSVMGRELYEYLLNEKPEQYSEMQKDGSLLPYLQRTGEDLNEMVISLMQSGRGTDAVSQQEAAAPMTEEEQERQHEALHETATQQVEQKSTEAAGGNNYQIGESLDLPNGSKARFRANADAIRLVKQLEAEGRNA